MDYAIVIFILLFNKNSQLINKNKLKAITQVYYFLMK